MKSIAVADGVRWAWRNSSLNPAVPPFPRSCSFYPISGEAIIDSMLQSIDRVKNLAFHGRDEGLIFEVCQPHRPIMAIGLGSCLWLQECSV